MCRGAATECRYTRGVGQRDIGSAMVTLAPANGSSCSVGLLPRTGPSRLPQHALIRRAFLEAH